MMNRSWIVLALVVAAVACGKSEEKPKVVDGVEIGKPIAARPIKIADFTMQEARQGALSNKDLEGKVWIGATIFTHCPGICPVLTQAMAELQDEFKNDADFRLVSVTVDPARDTSEVLTQFAGGYGAERGRWFFVRHPQRAETGTFVKTVLRLPYNDAEPLEHPPYITLINRDGTIRGMWDGTEPAAVEKLKKAIRETLDKKKRP